MVYGKMLCEFDRHIQQIAMEQSSTYGRARYNFGEIPIHDLSEYKRGPWGELTVKADIHARTHIGTDNRYDGDGSHSHTRRRASHMQELCSTLDSELSEFGRELESA